MAQLSYPYMTTGKTIALTRQTFVGKVMSQFPQIHNEYDNYYLLDCWVVKWDNLLLKVHYKSCKNVIILTNLHKIPQIDDKLHDENLSPLSRIARITTIPAKISQTQDLDG